MKLLFIAFFIYLIPISCLADELDEKIEKACLRHAVSLVSQFKSDSIIELNQQQSDKILKIATESCKNNFRSAFNENTQEDDDSDWLTDKILNSEVERKAGNKRLMKRR